MKSKIVGASMYLTQLRERVEGRPNPWPEGWVMDDEGVEAFRSTVREALAQSLPDAELVDVDCSECPCIASVRIPQADSNGFDATRKLVNSPAWIEAFGKPPSWGAFPLVGFPNPVDCGDGRKEQTLVVNSLDNCHEDPQERLARTSERILKGLPQEEGDFLFQRRVNFRKEQIYESWRCKTVKDPGR